MPRRFKVLSGSDVIKILESFSFVIVAQKGSHVKLVRLVDSERQVLIVPNHKELKQGTVSGLYSQAIKHIDESDLKDHFVQL
jgi:predicted RNA binding protein YcfA (HicA-like mRNA interferase family)